MTDTLDYIFKQPCQNFKGRWLQSNGVLIILASYFTKSNHGLSTDLIPVV